MINNNIKGNILYNFAAVLQTFYNIINYINKTGF